MGEGEVAARMNLRRASFGWLCSGHCVYEWHVSPWIRVTPAPQSSSLRLGFLGVFSFARCDMRERARVKIQMCEPHGDRKRTIAG